MPSPSVIPKPAPQCNQCTQPGDAKAARHPSLDAPKCIDCSHAADIDSRHSTCAHPQAERNLVDGRLSRTCWIERDSLRSYCGPDGLGFLPKTLPQSL